MKNGSLIGVAGLFLLDAILVFFFEKGVFRSELMKDIPELNLYSDIAIVICILIYVFASNKKE